MAEDIDEDVDGEIDFDSGGYDDGGGMKRLLLMVILPLLLVVVGAAGAYFSGLADPLLSMLGGDEPAVTEGVAEGAGTVDDNGGPVVLGAPVETAIFYDLPEMLVNLNTSGRVRNFLKMRVTLELASAEDIITVETVLPRIVDNFQVYLRDRSVDDLQGAAGMYRLREELLNRINSAVRPIRVNDVLFKEMIVQ